MLRTKILEEVEILEGKLKNQHDEMITIRDRQRKRLNTNEENIAKNKATIEENKKQIEEDLY